MVDALRVRRSLYNFRNLWVVDTAARHGSINRAAAHVSLTQPAVTRIVRTMERALNVSLFDRTRDGIVPTAFGALFLHRVRRSIGYLARAERVVGRESAGTRGARQSVPLHRNAKFRHLQALIEIAACGNATVAAGRMGVTQPAVHRSLRELEQFMGAALFERRHHRMVATRAGEIVLHNAKLALTELRYLEHELAARKGVVSGHVRVGILPLLQTMLVPQAVVAVKRQYPTLRFSILDRPYETLLAELRAGDIDVIVGALREPAPADDVTEEALFTDALSVVARAGHPLARRRRVRAAHMAGAGWIVPPEGTLIRRYFESFFRAAGLAVPDDLVETSSVATIRALLLESDRLSIIARGRIHYEERSGLLAPLAVGLPGTHRTIGLTIRSEASLPPGVEAFLETLRELSARSPFGNAAPGGDSAAQAAGW